MKHILVTLFAFLLVSSIKATTIKAKANGDWNKTTTWDLGRIPKDNDTIKIPVGFTVSVPGIFDLNNVVIIVDGVLDLSNSGKLRLDKFSKVIINSGGKLTGDSNDDQLKIGSDFKYKGPGTINGYAYADNTTGGGFITGTLPVIFRSFYVTRQGPNVQITWATSEEVNNAYYAIEESSDGHSWKQVATVAGAGTSAIVTKYAYTDKNMTDAVAYYRLRQVDKSGAAYYSTVREIHNNTTAVARIYTASNNKIVIDFNSDIKDNVSIQLINMGGQVIVCKEFSQASYRLIVDAMSAGSGVYAVRVSDSKGWSEVKKIAL